MGFRRDINGLRAIAVMAVVLFHFAVPGWQGGFVGVDVFFVISGYLMTGIIFTRLEQGRFSVVDFYLDRARRILPALGILCLVLLVVGWFLLLPADYETLGLHVIGSLGFLSNLMYWLDAGYFEAASHDKWLLHTWSLSVEWQFYLLYPLLILGLRRLLGANALRWAVLLGTLAAFAVSVVASSRWQSASFFLFPTRAWEMLAGGVVFLFPLQAAARARRCLQLLGLGLIAASLAWVDEAMAWPGWPALLPVLGTALVIAAARDASWLTGNALVQFLGRTSYSIYLWHWPLAVWVSYFGLADEPLWMLAGILASIGLGYLSHRHAENLLGRRPAQVPEAVRPRHPLRRLRPQTLVGAVFVSTGLLASSTLLAKGFPARLSPAFEAATEDLVMPSVSNGWCFYDLHGEEQLPVGEQGLRCAIGEDRAPRRGLLFGDSFAGHYAPFWDEIGEEVSASLNTVSTNWCYPTVTDEYTGPRSRGYDQCRLNRDYFRRKVADYDFVVFSGSWGTVDQQGKLDGVYRAVRLAARQTGLVVLMPAPTTFDVNVNNLYQRSLRFGLEFDIEAFGKERDVAAQRANDRLESFAERFDNVVFLEREALFHVDGVPSDVTEDNIPFSLDQNGHLSLYGAREAADAFRESPAFDALKEKIEKVEPPR